MMMARSFRIFILLIKVNKIFPFFRRRILFVRVSIEIRYKSTRVINLLAFFHEFVLEYEYQTPLFMLPQVEWVVVLKSKDLY